MQDPRPFWQTKSLEQMTREEWESLCDGCGLCCLVRFEDEDTGEVIPTRVHCKLFDPERCTCSDYANRKAHVPDCIKLKEGVEMIMPGDNAELLVELITPIAMDQGLRFAIREGGRTVGAGTVTEITE